MLLLFEIRLNVSIVITWFHLSDIDIYFYFLWCYYCNHLSHLDTTAGQTVKSTVYTYDKTKVRTYDIHSSHSPITLNLWYFLLNESSMPQRGCLITFRVASSISPVGGRSVTLWNTLEGTNDQKWICNQRSQKQGGQLDRPTSSSVVGEHHSTTLAKTWAHFCNYLCFNLER